MTAVVLLIASAAQAAGAGGRDQPVLDDLTSITGPVEPGTEIQFKVNYTDADDHLANYHTLHVDDTGQYIMEQLDPLDQNTSDGKLYFYNLTLPGGTHRYHYHFADAGNWSNTTDKTLQVLYAPSTGDWTVSGPLTVANATIELKGNLIVASGGALELQNTSVKFNGDTDGKYRIEVQSGGSLKVLDGSVISKASGAKAYNFLVKPGGSLEMKGSEVWYCGYENLTDNTANGIFVEGTTVIEDSTITAGGQGIGSKGIIAENCQLTMTNTTVKDAYRRNVEATNATIVMTNCTVDHSTDACNVEFFSGTKATITRCTIQNNGHNGIWMKDGAMATVTDCLITGSNQNGIWMDNGCTLTVSNTIIEKSKQNGMWINGSSTVTATNVTIRNNAMNGTWISGGRITMTLSTIDTHEEHGFAGFDGCQVTFTKNYVNNSKRHNYETTNCTTLMEDCRFDPSREACNVEFFVRSKATVRNTVIRGAGHNCFWLSDNVEVTIDGGNFSSSPNNVIWANLSSKVTVKNCVLWGAQKDGIWAADSIIIVEGCTIRDNGLDGGAMGWGIEVENCTLTVTNTNFSNNPKGQIYVKNYLTVTIMDNSGKALADAAVKIADQNNSEVFSGQSDAAGGIGGPKLLTTYIVDNTGKRTDYTYTITASKGDLEGSQSVPLDSAKSVALATKEKEKEAKKGGFIPGIGLAGLLVAMIGVGALLANRKRN